MRNPAGYAQRVARLPRVLEILSRHPDGLRIDVVAEELGVPAETLREDILVFYNLDIPEIGLVSDAIEFVSLTADIDVDIGEDPATAPVIRISSPRPLSEVGVDYLSADSLARVYHAATEILELEPDNEDLAGAVAALEMSLLRGIRRGSARTVPTTGPTTGGRHGQPVTPSVTATLRRAVHDRLRARITYARAWRPGSRVAEIEPYALVHTRRGWEVDAGPVDESLPDEYGQIRTYLVSGIVTADLLEERFYLPADVEARLRRHRTEVPVEVVVPQSRRWAVDRFAEHVEVLGEDADVEGSAKLRAYLLPPVPERLGLILLVAGEDAFVMDPPDLVDAGRALAARLMEHHAGGPH